MTDLAVLAKKGLGREVFSDTDLRHLLGGTPDCRYGLVKRALARRELLRLRRGLYCLPDHLRAGPLDLFALAPLIYGPSYVSFESALSRHGWIPEAVYAVTSATSRRARDFATPYGRFSYRRVPRCRLLVGVERREENGQVLLLASPWKALADYVCLSRLHAPDLAALAESLRLDPAVLVPPPEGVLAELRAAFRDRRTRRFLRGVSKGFGQ